MAVSADIPTNETVVIPSSPPRLSDYLRDGCGDPSSMRLMMFIAVIVGIGFGVLAVFRESTIALNLAIWVWGFAFTGKAAQSLAEQIAGNCR